MERRQFNRTTPARPIVLLELQDDKVLRETWYFAPPSEAPAWRAHWVERIG